MDSWDGFEKIVFAFLLGVLFSAILIVITIELDAAEVPNVIHFSNSTVDVPNIYSDDTMLVYDIETNTTRVTVTAYQSDVNQTDSTPNITCINTKVGPGTIAVSRDMFELLNIAFGDKLYIMGYGVYVVNDIMNKRYTRSVDIWVPKNAKTFKEENVLVVRIKDGK